MYMIFHILDLTISVIFIGFFLILIFPKLTTIITNCIFWLQNKFYKLFE
jgi:hypothetical protein